MKDLAVSDRLTIPASELAIGFARSGGPGGQNVNKVESKVELRWCARASAALAALGEAEQARILARLGQRLTTAGELVITSSRTRDQSRNREDAQAKLVAIVREAMARPRARKATRPTRGSTERRIRAKRHRGEVKRIRRQPPES